MNVRGKAVQCVRASRLSSTNPHKDSEHLTYPGGRTGLPHACRCQLHNLFNSQMYVLILNILYHIKVMYEYENVYMLSQNRLL